MKFIIVELLAVTLLTTSVASASSKICFGAKNNEYTSGAVLTVETKPGQLTIKTIKIASEFDQDFTVDQGYNGVFTSLEKTVKGKDENLYLTYAGVSSEERQDVILIDSKLLTKQTVGLLKIRSAGETFSEGVYVCKDLN